MSWNVRKRGAATHSVYAVGVAGSDVDLLVHDLRGVLTTIRSWASLAEVQVTRGLLPSEAIHGLLQACAAADAVVEGYEGNPQQEKTELIGFLSRLEQAFSHEFHQRGVVMQVIAPAQPVWAAAATGDLTIVLVNLLRNALEASERGDQVRISIRPGPQDAVELVVEDNGEGLDEASLESIFLPGISGRGSGRGLGLHAAHLAATRAKGMIRAGHSRLGGAAFFFSVSRALPNPSRADVTPSASASVPDIVGRILIVEDDPATRRFMQAALEHEGHEVLQAGSLKQARTLLPQAELVVVDDRLPDGSGPDLQHETSAPLMIVSGNPALKEKTNLHILRKPFDVLELCASVREHLARGK